MVVSLEAVFLSTFVMISQNRADAKRQVIANEQWTTVQDENEQNRLLLHISNQILQLTSDVHAYARAAAGETDGVARAIRSASSRAPGSPAAERMPECPTADGVTTCEDGVRRCSWACSPADYHDYHDLEWGFPVSADVRLFEKLSLEGFQAGLSWLTILRKRDAFREAFVDFDYERVARFTGRDVERLLANADIVRHRGKIEAVINNAKRAVELVKAEGSIAHYVWGFEPAAPDRLADTLGQLPATTSESVALAKDLKRRGWRFVGPTTIYAFMQAMGLVNDHRQCCDARDTVTEARRLFARP